VQEEDDEDRLLLLFFRDWLWALLSKNSSRPASQPDFLFLPAASTSLLRLVSGPLLTAALDAVEQDAPGTYLYT
jgi:hypothetical protein